MSTDTHEIYVHLVDVYWDLAGRLSRIRMEMDIALSTQLPNGLDILDDSNFVIDCHDTAAKDVLGLVRQDGLEGFEIYESVCFDWHISDFEAFQLEVSTAIEHTLMFSLQSHYVFFLL